MRLIIDGLTAHTPTWQRGIGKTVENLLRQTFFHFRLSEIIVTCFADAIASGIPENTRSVQFHRVDRSMMRESFNRRAVLYSTEIEQLSGDRLNTVFWHPNPLMLDQILPYYLTLPTLATIYDYIPLRNREMYMSHWPQEVQDEYRLRLQFLSGRNVHVAAISETVAQQTRELMPLARNVCAVPIGYNQELMVPRLGTAFDSKTPYVIMVTGDDPRKNQVSFVEAFCMAVEDGRDINLKIVCAISDNSRSKIAEIVKRYNCTDRVEVLGFVTDHRLAALVRNAAVAAMPSFDEGFGLPVVEAMGCGVPVISSDIPTSREVGGDLVYYFDPTDTASMAETLKTCLGDLARGRIDTEALIAQARKYSWVTAGKAYRSLLQDIALPALEITGNKPRVALLTPWPPNRTGIAKCGEMLAKDLNDWCDLTVVVEEMANARPQKGISLISVDAFDEAEFDLVICQLGNNTKYHSWIYDHALSAKAIAIVHDTYIHPFLQEGYRQGKLRQQYLDMLANHFPKYRVAEIAAGGFAAVSVFDYTGLSSIAKTAGGMLVHNRFGYEAVVREEPEARARLAMTPLVMPAEMPDIAIPEPHQNKFVFGMFGYMTPFKLPLEVLSAMQTLISRGFPIELRIIGELGTQESAVLEAIDRLDLHDTIVQVAFVEDHEFMAHIAACDVVINLRHPTLGESSAVAYEAMRLGRTVIVSDNGSFTDLPDDAVVKVSPTPHVADELSERLFELLCSPEKRQRISKKAQLYTNETGSLEQYIRVLRNLMFKVLDSQTAPTRTDS